MFGGKKKPSVRIPASVLKKEAEKMAKKMKKTEEKREKQKRIREKAKEKAFQKRDQQKQRQEQWDDFLTDHLKREIWGGIWIVLAILLLVLFWSPAPFAQQIFRGFRFLFGIGTWLIPPFLLGIGLATFLKKEIHFHPGRIIALFLFYFSILGIIHLFVPHADSHALAAQYGGAIGFALGYFPRELFGDIAAGVIFVGMLWISGIISFGIRISTFFLKSSDENTASSKKKEPKEKIAEKHFKNELEIVDAVSEKKKKENGKSIDLEKEEESDELTEAKNREIAGKWEPPDIELLKDNSSTIVVDENDLRQKAEIIREKLEQFNIEVEMKSVHVGPTVTQFTLEPAAGVKLNKITSLKKDIALALAAENVRIEAPIQGKSLVGIEIPNKKRTLVGMREILESHAWEAEEESSSLKLALGRDVAGKPIVADLAKMPHLLIAGKTGSGKSVAMNAFLCSLLWQNSPEQLKLILVDPKRVELSLYNHLPHLLTPVIMEPEKCVSALAWAVAEMNRRYKSFSENKCRNITEYNEKFPEKKEPFIVIVIDELADLMMVAGKDVEAAICRIAQLARAVGMHLIVATQRPSVDVVTGLIKANLSSRIAFKVSSGIDSRTILDGQGAEDLLGFGDMLSLDGNNGKITRIQGIFISNEEIERITNHIKLQFPELIGNDEIQKEITAQSIDGMAKGGVLTAGTKEVGDEDLDDLYEEAIDTILETGKASASFLQRRLEIGYARAARILDQMESRGVIGPSRGSKPREVFGRKEK
ncbi:DNA translocase FtsK [Candidatus Gracilibacteria bacterium]|nr:DNA translocase FtsK [Candidatus Gracilibacteria bacterium]MCF7819400.1 DNA translocase FtsK [Candidatus Gracilibacteria bacterium]